jgi:hypothetical protein
MVQYATDEALNDARIEMGGIRVMIDKIRQDRDMSADEKRQEIWSLTRERNKLARDVTIKIRQAQEEEEERLVAEQQQQQVAAGAQ